MAILLALLLAFPRPAAAHLGHAVGSRLAVAQQVGPLVLDLVIETPPRTPGPLFVDVVVDRPTAATLLVSAVPRDAAAGTDDVVRLNVKPGDPGPYLAEFALPGPGAWDVVVALADAGAGDTTATGIATATVTAAATATARVPVTVAPPTQPLALRVAGGALAAAGGLVVAAFAAVGIAVRRRLAPPRGLLLAVSHAVVACLVVAAVAATQAAAAPPADRLPVADGALPHANLLVRADPAVPRAGEPATLVLDLVDGATGRPVDDLAPHHEALLHLVMVGDDGSDLAHLHPARIGPGRFAIEVTPTRPGPHTLYAEITRRGGSTQVVARPLLVAGDTAPAPPPPLLPEPGRVHAVEGLDIAATVAAADGSAVVRAGEPTTLRFALSRDGRPAADIQPWLGMPGHLFVRGEDGAVFAHVHALGPMTSGAADSSRRFGPEIGFAYAFPAPGAYRVWFQFKHDNRVLTLPLRIVVADEEG